MDVVVSCSSSCEIPEAFRDYIFINQSVFHSSEDHTYTFEVLPSKTTNGSFMCQAFHEADTLFTDFCNVSDHILPRNLTGIMAARLWIYQCVNYQTLKTGPQSFLCCFFFRWVRQSCHFIINNTFSISLSLSRLCVDVCSAWDLCFFTFVFRFV